GGDRLTPISGLSVTSCVDPEPRPLPSTGVTRLQRCRVGGGAPKCWPPSAAQTGRAVFPHPAFTMARQQRRSSERLGQSRLTSPGKPIELAGRGACEWDL